MLNRVSKPEQANADRATAEDTEAPVYLTSEPAHFFSNDFRTRMVRDDAEAPSASEERDTRRDENWGLVLMILTVGVPILGYCVLTAM